MLDRTCPRALLVVLLCLVVTGETHAEPEPALTPPAESAFSRRLRAFATARGNEYHQRHADIMARPLTVEQYAEVLRYVLEDEPGRDLVLPLFGPDTPAPVREQLKAYVKTRPDEYEIALTAMRLAASLGWK